MHLLKNLDNNSDTMQLAIVKNLDGTSLGELLDFILRFLMRSWISYASVGARNNEFFEFMCVIKCLWVLGDGFIFVERDFPTSEKNCSNLHIVFGILSLQKAYFLLGFVFYCYYFIDKLPCFFCIMMAFLESLFIIILFGDFF